jgi:hypothetical protein
MVWRNGGRNPILLRHCSRRKGKPHLQDPGISHVSFSLSPFSIPLSFLGIGNEVRRGWQIMRKDIEVHKGNHQLY